MTESAHETARAPWPKRVALGALMAIVAVNVWTGGPLLALWLGSQLQQRAKSSLTIRPSTAIVVFVSLVAITWALARLLGIVSRSYDRASGVNPEQRREHAPWLRSERPLYPGDRPSPTLLERVLVIAVVLAALAFEIWFFFYSTSPIDGRSGRSGMLQGPGSANDRV